MKQLNAKLESATGGALATWYPLKKESYETGGFTQTTDGFLLDPSMIASYVHHDDRDKLNAWMESPADTQIVFLGL